MDFSFLGASMGSVVGERITYMIEGVQRKTGYIGMCIGWGENVRRIIKSHADGKN